MINVCFGDSECGMLRLVFGKKNVFRWYGLLDLGDISTTNFENARKKQMETFLYKCSAKQKARLIQQEQESVAMILQRVEQGEALRIWVASEPRSKCGFYHVMHTMKATPIDIFAVEMPDNIGYRGPGYDRSWGEADPFAIEQCLSLQRLIRADERAEIAARWEKLAVENAPLRLNIDGEIKSVPVDYLDEEILSCAPQGPFVLISLVGNMLGRSRHGVSDGFILDRVVDMTNNGRFRVVSGPENAKKAGTMDKTRTRYVDLDTHAVLELNTAPASNA